MKKFLAIILGAMFVMSFAATAFAIHAEIPAETAAVVAKGDSMITLGGEIRTRGWWTSNIAAGLPKKADNAAWYDERIRLSVDAQVTPNVEGFVQFESGAASSTVGANQSDLVTWGNFNSKLGGMNILQAWILYKNTSLLGFGSGLKIGHMPLALGEKQFFDHTKFGDDAIVFFMDPTKDLHIGLLTIKFAEGDKAVNGDDIDGYVGLFVLKLDAKSAIGVNYTYLNQPSSRMKLSNLGVHANGNVAGLGYKAEGDFQFGDVTSGLKAKGYGAMAGLSFTVDPATLRAAVAYGSGDKADTTGKKEDFITFLDDGVQSGLNGNPNIGSFIYEYLIKSASGRRYAGISNTTYLNIGADFVPVKGLKTSIDGWIFRASKTNTAIAGSDSKNAGWEVDGRIVYNVARNLDYQVDAGYFKAGALYGPDKKGAAALRHMITLSF